MPACADASAGADFVLHHAAEASVPHSIDDPAACVAVNIGGTVNLLEAASRRNGQALRVRVLLRRYGDTPGASKHEASPADPLSPYASSKLAGEYFCRNFFRLHGLQTVACVISMSTAPARTRNGAYAAVIPKFITAIAAGRKADHLRRRRAVPRLHLH